MDKRLDELTARQDPGCGLLERPHKTENVAYYVVRVKIGRDREVKC